MWFSFLGLYSSRRLQCPTTRPTTIPRNPSAAPPHHNTQVIQHTLGLFGGLNNSAPYLPPLGSVDILVRHYSPNAAAVSVRCPAFISQNSYSFLRQAARYDLASHAGGPRHPATQTDFKAPMIQQPILRSGAHSLTCGASITLPPFCELLRGIEASSTQSVYSPENGYRPSLRAAGPQLQTRSPVDQQSLDLSRPEVVAASGSSIPFSVTAQSDAWGSHYRPQPSQAPRISGGESPAHELEDAIRLSHSPLSRRAVRCSNASEHSLPDTSAEKTKKSVRILQDGSSAVKAPKWSQGWSEAQHK